MSDHTPAAPAALSQQPTAAQLDELERLYERTVGETWARSKRQSDQRVGLCIGSARKGYYWVLNWEADDLDLVLMMREMLPALIAGCRAAGAATPPALDQRRAFRDAVLNIKVQMPYRLPDNEPDAYREGHRDALFDAADLVLTHPTLTDGAGATTPALTAEDRAHVDRVRAKCNSGQPVNATLLLLGVIDRLTAATAGVAAAPSPAAPHSSELEPLEVMPPAHPFTADERQRIDDYVAGWKAGQPKAADAPGPQREEPTP